MIMVILDTTIVNVAIDALSRELDASLATTQWVITGYLLALGVAVSVAGWANDRFGAKPVWIFALVLFTIGSALCATAWSMPSLIAFRLLQGLGGGLMMPTAQTIIVRAAGPARLGRAMSILGVPMLLGPVFGPVIGGLLVEKVTWHWIFIVNVPIGVFAIWLASRKLSNGGALATPRRFDVVGIALFAAGFVSVLYGLSEAASKGTFDDGAVIAWIVAGVVLLGSFVGYSMRRGQSAVIDVRLYANRLFASGSITIFLVGIALFGGMLLLPLYYQAVRGEGALNAGLLLAPQGLGAALVMPIAGRLVDRVGAGNVVPFGLVLALVGTFPFTQLTDDTAYGWLAGALFVRGMGLGATMMPTMAAAYARLSHDDVSRAAPMLIATQQLDGSFGSALLVTVLTQQVVSGLAERGIEASGGAAQMSSLSPEAREQVAPVLAGVRVRVLGGFRVDGAGDRAGAAPATPPRGVYVTPCMTSARHARGTRRSCVVRVGGTRSRFARGAARPSFRPARVGVVGDAKVRFGGGFVAM